VISRSMAGARVRLSFSISLIALATTIITHAAGQDRLDLSTKAIEARAAAYVADYQTKFAFLVASEMYTQAVTRTGADIQRRVMHGELFLTFLRADHEWIAVHDIADVDGTPVPGRENLQTLLQQADVTSVAQRVADRNAQFNIGSVTRNFNEPTLALLVLESKRIAHFRFNRKDLAERDGVLVATLAFIEHDSPTLVRDADFGPVYSRGELIVEATTGRVRRSVISFDDQQVQATLTTDYVFEDRLGLQVPSVFTEHYDFKQGRAHEVTSCEATYSNYRRFEVTGRIK